MSGLPGWRMREMLAETRPLLGIFACIPAFQATELLGGSGLDFIMLEAEHAATSLPVLHAQTAVLAGSGVPVLVRMDPAKQAMIKQVLDIGVDGVMFANVESASQARALVSGLRFAPAGERGVGGSVRAAGYGRRSDLYRKQDETPSVWVQIESRVGLAALEEICAVAGVDVVFFGPMDLSARLGHPAQPSHPEVKQTIAEAARRAQAAGKVTGILCGEAECGEWAAVGVRALLVGSDVGLLVKAVDGQTARLRESLGLGPA